MAYENPICPYCNSKSERVYGDKIYPRRPDLWAQIFYRCKPCKAWVGTHKNSNGKPLGRLANLELRRAKGKAHAAFDRLWKAKMQRDDCSKSQARKAGYRWLAEQLEIDPKDCHIGMFDVEMCNRVADICGEYLK